VAFTYLKVKSAKCLCLLPVVLVLVLSSLLWRSTVAFTYLKVKSAKCLCLLPVVLVVVLRIWSCLHHCLFCHKSQEHYTSGLSA